MRSYYNQFNSTFDKIEKIKENTDVSTTLKVAYKNSKILEFIEENKIKLTKFKNQVKSLVFHAKLILFSYQTRQELALIEQIKHAENPKEAIEEIKALPKENKIKKAFNRVASKMLNHENSAEK